MNGRRYVLVGLVALLGASGTSAQAAPLLAGAERADNTLGFTYDADTGELPTLTSSAVSSANDRVTFWLDLRARPQAEVGSRLRGIMHFKLRGKRAVRYKGRLRLVVKNAEEEVVLTRSKFRRFTLWPNDRTAGPFRFRFDVADGANYAVVARFTPPDR